MALAEELQTLAPFGRGNPGVSLMVADATFRDGRPMGEGKHVRFTVASRGARARAVAFGTGGRLPVDEGEPARGHVHAGGQRVERASQSRAWCCARRAPARLRSGPPTPTGAPARRCAAGAGRRARAVSCVPVRRRLPRSRALQSGWAVPYPMGMAIAKDPKSPQQAELADAPGLQEMLGRRPAGSSGGPRRMRSPRQPPRTAPARSQRARAAPARRPVRDRLRARGGLRGRDRPRARAGRVRVRLRAPRRAAAQVRRGLHRAPGRRGADLRGHAPGHRDAVRGAAARHRRGHLGLDRGGARALRRGDRGDRRRRDEADRASPSSRTTRRRPRTTAR